MHPLISFLRRSSRPATLTAALLASASAFADPSIVNGSFEGPVLAAPGKSTGTITGWIKTFHGPIALVSGNIQDGNGDWYGVTPFGNQYVGLDPISTGFRAGVSQVLSDFVAGQTYALTLYVADSDGGKAPQLEVMFSDGGSTVYLDTVYNVPLGGPYGDVIAFTELTTYFTAPVSGDIALSLFNAGSAYITTDPGSISIDNVSISAVPEPSTAASLLLGLGGLAGWVRRRRQRAA